MEPNTKELVIIGFDAVINYRDPYIVDDYGNKIY